MPTALYHYSILTTGKFSMCTKHLKSIFAGTLLIIGATFSNYGNANAFIIDDFTQAQTVFDRGNSLGATTSIVNSFTGTNLINASRAFTALATANKKANREDITSDSGLLSISNSITSSGTATILWQFDLIDLNVYSNAFLLDVVTINHDFKIEMIANGTSQSTSKNINAVDNYQINFSDFSDSNVFKNLSSLQLNFTGPLTWSGQFKLSTIPQASVTSVPVPPALALMSSALLGLMGLSNRKKLLTRIFR